MAEVASTKTFRSSKRTTLSIMPCWFSKDIEYWNPEHPPPTTPMRRPAGKGSCVAIISFTLVIAEGVKFTGCVGGGPVTTSGVVTAVAMRVSLEKLPFLVYAAPPSQASNNGPDYYLDSLYRCRARTLDSTTRAHIFEDLEMGK